MKNQLYKGDLKGTAISVSDRSKFLSFVGYQIYPKSFQDSNSDGIGDLPGIISRLDYLVELGVNLIWMNPMFPSPMADNGYDVSDYYSIDPTFGTIDDYINLINKAHKLGISVLLDMVPNHTSIEHPWFIESRSSKNNPKRDWYIWRPPKPDGSTPNNWYSLLSPGRTSAWKYDEKTGEYYLHTHLVEQPDLNWRNEEMRKEMYKIMKYWLDLGVDGFRMDAINYLMKDLSLRDEPLNSKYDEKIDLPCNILDHIYMRNQPEIFDLINEISCILKPYGKKLFLGEAYDCDEFLPEYYSKCPDYTAFNFMLVKTSWDAENLRNLIDTYYESLPDQYIPNFVLGTHDVGDQPNKRLVSRLGEEKARVAAMLLLTLRGIPFIYNGEELGLNDSLNFEGVLSRDPLERDRGRKPFPWDESLYAGFSDVNPWLPLDPESNVFNVKIQTKNSLSMLQLYRKLIYYRKKSLVLKFGDYHSLALGNISVYSYTREYLGKECLIILNLSESPQEVILNKIYSLICSTFLDIPERTICKDRFNLRPLEGVIFEEKENIA